MRYFFIIFTLLVTKSFAQDPNFHIYLCFGQSNMEGQGSIESQDEKVNRRFKVLQSVDCLEDDFYRKKGKWYKAKPPLCRCNTHLSPVDYFGKTMVAGLPDSITVGVINVAIGGCDIRSFDKDIYQEYDSTYTAGWFQYILHQYGNNPYEHLISLAKMAQKDGVIKGILLHQGETNTGNAKWPNYVNKIYNDLVKDLSLDKKTTPLLAGEVVHKDQDGRCAKMNTIINTLPDTLENAHVISSAGCEDKEDNIHFNSAGYRELGKRYALTMLSLLYHDYNPDSTFKYSEEEPIRGQIYTAKRLKEYLDANEYDKAISLFSFGQRKQLVKQLKKRSNLELWSTAWKLDDDLYKKYLRQINGGSTSFIFEGGEWKIDEEKSF